MPGVARAPGLVVFLLTALWIGGCGSGADQPGTHEEGRGSPGPAAIWLQDQAGRTVELAGPPERVISLVPAATEVILALGERERLVGRTDYDSSPELAQLPSVGQGLHPSLERLISLDPNLVIRFEGPQDRDTPQALERAGIVHLGVRPDRIADVLHMVELLARALGREDRGRDLDARIRGELEEVERRVGGAPRPEVAFLLGGDPPWIVTDDTFLHELLEIAGGRNALGDLGTLYAPVSVETIVQRQVHLVLAPESATIPAALRGMEVRRVPDEVQSPGVDLGASAKAISRVLHPELWP
jgi:iron complex transport system substrate-binding protein